MMRKTIVLFLFLMVSALAFAQSFSSLVVLVVEKQTGKPIANAAVMIKETGWTGKSTGIDGKVVFDKSMPVGEINYVVTRDGYQGLDGRFNITTEVKSNTLRLELAKTPMPESDKVLIRGEVTDKNNLDIAGALVEVKIGNLIKTDTTDRSGNYLIELELSKTVYQENAVRIEVKDRGCKKVETVSLPRTNVINKDFQLECRESLSGPGNEESDVNPAWRRNNQPVRTGNDAAGALPPSASLKKETVDGVEISVERCEIVYNKLICHVIYRNVGNMPNARVIFSHSYNSMTDENGLTYESQSHFIGNIEARGYTKYDLVKGAVVRSRIEFLIGDTSFKRLSRLQIGNRSHRGHNFYDIPVTKGG